MYCLDGDIVEIEGVRIGGTDGWYDGSLGRRLGCSGEFFDGIWNTSLGDKEWITGYPDPEQL
ncbi:hypothetical protein NST84_09850 [Paenibacillus sp. FSL R7-0345]|uniref:hypothetical protein n=1 Tax=Paenibacillus sp. FSL R7-0345 TaxID=2954535 RepID=UPI00315AE1D9